MHGKSNWTIQQWEDHITHGGCPMCRKSGLYATRKSERVIPQTVSSLSRREVSALVIARENELAAIDRLMRGRPELGKTIDI